MKTGSVLYTINGYIAKVTKIENEKLYVEEEYPVTMTSNAGRKLEHLIRKQINVYQLSDIGILLFYEKSDIDKHKNLEVDSKRYMNSDGIIKYFAEKNNKTVNEIKKDEPYGPIITDEDRERIILSYYDESTNKVDDEIFFNMYPNSTCFARMDFDTHFFRKHYEKYLDNHYYDRVYIGKSLYRDLGNGVHIVNWRSPIANFYYDATITSKTSDVYVDVVNKTLLMNPNNVYEYELLLKRNFSSISPLKCNNLYIANNDFFAEGSYDPFLMEVLIEKRSNHKMTDIIKSIQSNQNSIIRENHKSNIIVQGCAGSGKTMILLHRLSYLKYNNFLPNSKFVKVITPNKEFSLFINDLANSLELEDVERITMIDYLWNLCLQYQSLFSIENKKNEYGLNLSKSELEVNADAINFLIGFDIIKNSEIEEKHSNIQMSIEKIYQEKFDEYVLDLNIKFFEDICKKSTVEIFEKSKMTNKDFLEKIYYIAREILPQKQTHLIEKLEKLNAENKISENSIVKINDFKEKIANKRNSVDNLIDSLFQLEIDIKNYFDYCLKNLDEKSSSFIFFSRKARAQSAKRQLLKKLSTSAKFDDLDNWDSDILPQEKHEEYKTVLRQIYNSLKEIVYFVYALDKPNLDKRFNTSYEVISIYRQLSVEDTYDSYENLLSAAEQFKEALLSLERNCETIVEERQIKLAENINSINETKNQLLTSDEKDFVNNIVKKLRYRGSFIVNIFKEKLYDFNETTLNKNAILQLLGLFVLHCGALKNADQMIFIDEGQDYSNFEYFLLRRALGEKATFNVYGDVKQCVNTVNGTLDWENISIESEYKKFEINENYRNSIEITNFVKEELGIKMSPIGISGENPQFIAMEDIELYVKKSVEKNSNVRIAIISNNKKIFNQTFTSETNSIFIGDVIESKGLEFDVVFVNDENMNKNEKYISYTRALSELYIVR